MAYEWYLPKTGKPCVSIGKYGITFSKEGLKKIGNPDYLMGGYDKRNNKIILKPCGKDGEYSMKLGKGKCARLTNKGFIKFLISKNIVIGNKAKKYNIQWDESMKVYFIENKGGE